MRIFITHTEDEEIGGTLLCVRVAA
jgi:hypothetical protein